MIQIQNNAKTLPCRWGLFASLISLLLVLSSTSHAQQIIQITSGWCSPTIANVTGDVVIKCIGVPPPVHKKLSDELARLISSHQLETQQLVNEANEWVSRYNSLEQHLQTLTGSHTEFKEIQQLVSQGRFQEAATRLDTNLAQYDKHLKTLAEYHYLRASVAALSFEFSKANEHVQKAYQYQPQNPVYLLAFADTLMDQGQLKKAETLLRQALPSLRARASTGSIDHTANLLNALDKLSVTLIRLNSAEELDELSDEAMDVAMSFLKQEGNQEELRPGVYEMMSALVYSFGRDNFIKGRINAAENILGTAFGWNLDLCSKISAKFCRTAAAAIAITAQIDSIRGNYARAKQRFQLALDTLLYFEGNSRPLPDRANILFLSAETSLLQQDNHEAEKIYQTILDTWRQGEYLDQNHRYVIAHAYNKLGEFEVIGKRNSEGEAYFRRALTLTKDYTSAIIQSEWALASVNLAHLYASQNMGDRALTHAVPAAQVFHQQWEKDKESFGTYYARSLFVLGYSQLVSGNKKAGCENLRRVGVVEPGGPWHRIIEKDQVSCK